MYFDRVLLSIAGIFLLISSTTHASSSLDRTSLQEKIVLAGGCFWGMEAVFEHVKGVNQVISGYTGGNAETADYQSVSQGYSHHAEAVEITYNPKHISLERILQIYFTTAHNPTQLNYQGPDHGTQYRSTIFYQTELQKNAAQLTMAEVIKNELYETNLVTTLEPLTVFYPAESYHQNFVALHPDHPYILRHDAPKIIQLKKQFSDWYREDNM